MENDAILIENFWEHTGDHHLRKSDLFWGDTAKLDARSDDPETIFRYFIEEVGFNMSFYWLEDRELYIIRTEEYPTPVIKCSHDPDWDGVYELHKFHGRGATYDTGEILCEFEDVSKIWDELTINGKHLSEILPNSVILEMD